MVTKRIIAGLFLVTGCAADVSVPGRDAPNDSSRETRGAEVPTTPAVPEPSSPAAPSAPAADPPLLSWGFEPASADCNGWPVLGADAIRASPPRSGSYSCKVCADGSADGFSLGRDVGPVPAGRYLLSAWVRKRAETEAPGEASARIEALTEGGASVGADAPPLALDYEWARLEATLDLAEPASNLRLTIGSGQADAAGCVFVDDVTVVRQPR